LYQHIISPDFPSLSFIGIPKVVVPFPLFHCQVLFVISGLTGSVPLPSKAEMLAEIERDYQQRLSAGLPPRYAHHMDDRQWGYNHHLAALGKFERLPGVLRKLYDFVHDERRATLMTYKKMQFAVTGEEEFQLRS
jgi:hypothetical protein